jgi:hypothetical protein
MSMVDPEARERIQALEEWAAQRDREVAKLSSTVSRLAATVEAIGASLAFPSPAIPSNLRPAPVRPLPAPSLRPPCPPAPARPAPPVSVAKAPVAPSAAAAPDPRVPVRPPPQAPPPGPSSVALPAAPAGFASLIVVDFPALFAELCKKSFFGREKRFALLCRGSRDGFGARDFHCRCDGHAPTLTLIQDRKGNIFGGFTPVMWEARKADPSLKSFLFTLKNPHNLPARKFALKAEKKDSAIWCHSSWGPCFCDVGVYDNCNVNTRSCSSLGHTYAIDTGRDGKTVLTDSFEFTVKEIEVFEIAD